MALLPDTLPAGPVRLDRWQESQLEELMAAISLSYEELHRWMPWAASMPSAEAELKVLNIGVEAFEGDFEWQYLVRESRTGDLVGGAGLRRRSGLDALEVGYWTRSDRTGRGYATAAAWALTSAAFTHVRAVDTVEIHTDAANLASAAIPPKLGFVLARTEPRPPETRGATGNFLVWEAKRCQWPVQEVREVRTA